MISAIDSNVLLDILIPNEAFADTAAVAIEDAATSGSLVVSDIVYAEICIQFATQRESDRFFTSNEIRVEPLDRSAHFLASRIWREYRAQGGKRDRILPDFLIGAHAQVQANQLISRDRGFYRALFPKLRLVDPSSLV
jgi:predicted nucleic acid-binding protein